MNMCPGLLTAAPSLGLGCRFLGLSAGGLVFGAHVIFWVWGVGFRVSVGLGFRV